MRKKHVVRFLVLGVLVGVCFPRVVTFRGDSEYVVWQTILSPDGKTLVGTSSSHSTVWLWDVRTGRVRATIHSNTTRALAVSPDNKMLALCGMDKRTIQVWDLTADQELVILSGYRGDPEYGGAAVAFSPDSKMLVSGRGAVQVWDVSSGKEIATFPAVGAWDVAFNPDGTILAAFCNRVETIKLWNVADWKERATFGESKGICQRLAFSPDGKTLAVTSHGLGPTTMGVHLWDVATGQERVSECSHIADLRPDEEEDKSTMMYLAFSPDGKTVASGNEWTIGLWDVASGKNTASFGLGGRRLFPLSGGFLYRVSGLWAHDNYPEIASVAFTPEGELRAFGENYNNEHVVMWRVTSVRLNE